MSTVSFTVKASPEWGDSKPEYLKTLCFIKNGKSGGKRSSDKWFRAVEKKSIQYIEFAVVNKMN